MRVIDADKFLSYLIFSKHIDVLTCGEVKEAIEIRYTHNGENGLWLEVIKIDN